MSLDARALSADDEAALRSYWRRKPHAHIFAEADLDELGWKSPERLNFWGWFADGRLVGYLMRYGISMSWDYEDERLIPRIAAQIDAWQPAIQFVSGMTAETRPVLAALCRLRVIRTEESFVNQLNIDRFTAYQRQSPIQHCREATWDDIDALTEIHMAADDQWSRLNRDERRRALRNALRNPGRRVVLATNRAGIPVATAQSIADGRRIAVIGSVATSPAWRNQGYGREVTAFLCRRLVDWGQIPHLFYRQDNLPAATIYAKLGFEIVDEGLIVELADDSQ
ncbi:MAG: GNAT family N-acetyltransferase [Anaerolineales bacterium]|nr:GNAT family N-acetyltransferase [Anaerolineales bacterium]MCB9129144.1 GNAT family N-acetyltransferase [Ardenticatenales bacterium]